MAKPKVIQHDTFKNHEGETVNRYVLDVDGQTVQVLQYDESPRVVVLVNDTAAQVDQAQVKNFVTSQTGGA